MKTFICIFVLFTSTCLFSTIINVPGDQPTIQAGINVAVDTDTVLVQPGTYVENINYNGKLITVASLFLTTQDTTYISQTIIDGDNIDSVVKFESGEDAAAVLCGFTITNGYAIDAGGGIYCIDSSPSLENITISSNSASGMGSGRGGGIFCDNSSSILQNVTIIGNSVIGSTQYICDGGGIYCENNSNPSLENVIIASNSADSKGGGIYCAWDSSPSLVNVTITGNSAYDGGGIYFKNNSSTSLENVTITGNNAEDKGGGIYYENSCPSFSVDNRCNIYSNTIGNARGFGADIFAEECDTIHVIVDTFTVMMPTDYYASPINNFTFDILHSIVDSLINADVYVSVDGDNSNSGTSPDLPFKTIKHALGRIYGDSLNIHTIHLAPGNYSNSTNGEIFPIHWINYVNLSGNNEDNTILDAESTSSVMDFDFVTNAIISNITITNGFASNGGGIDCSDSSSPIFKNVTIIGNSAIDSEQGGKGGGIFCSNSSPELENVTITGNYANENGGGIYCFYYSNPILINVTITSNWADYGGGGIFCSNSSPNIENVTISDNTGYRGGGIHCYYSSPSLINLSILNNWASENGGGICCINSFPNLTNVTISGNNANGDGSGIFCAENSAPDLVNCIMWNDLPEEIYFYEDWDPNSIIISYSDIQGGEAGIVTNNNGTVNWLEGNIDEDPLFAETGEDPYSLLEDSPCIDTGIPDTSGLNLPPWDIIGNLRIWDGDGNGSAIIDMGAYEYGAPPYVDIDDNLIVQTPEVLLHQNYPNPFNPTTTINYSLNENSKVSLNIYNIKGQKVKTLVNEIHESGNHTVIWKGTDDNGKSVSSGVYFYKLKTTNFEKTRKMILLK